MNELITTSLFNASSFEPGRCPLQIVSTAVFTMRCTTRLTFPLLERLRLPSPNPATVGACKSFETLARRVRSGRPTAGNFEETSLSPVRSAAANAHSEQGEGVLPGGDGFGFLCSDPGNDGPVPGFLDPSGSWDTDAV